MHACFVTCSDKAISIELVTEQSWFTCCESLSASDQQLTQIAGFAGRSGQKLIIPAQKAKANPRLLFGIGAGEDSKIITALAAELSPGIYRLENASEYFSWDQIGVAWVDGAYQFDRYKTRKFDAPILVLPTPSIAEDISNKALALDHLRDLINTPAADMGPDAIQADVNILAKAFEGECKSWVGEELLSNNYPMIHAVGRGAQIPPRYIELSWGAATDPLIAIVGKGVVFDTGGLNIKQSQSMRLMKKDMGGAAHAIALAEMIMRADLPLRLRLCLPLVENAIGPNAFRPGDILSSRAGKTVEIEDTDAEGRLVLADALYRACEDAPELIVDYATLTGAARTALGPDLAPFYTDDDNMAEELITSSVKVNDPIWRMPLWTGYRGQLSSAIADLKNLGDSPMGGSIMAALFLKEFVSIPNWLHFDVWGWQKTKYSKPEGAAAQGVLAVFEYIRQKYRI